MAQTMLYVNEHLHDQLYDGDVDPEWIRSFAPGDYLVVSTANGDRVAISGHPAERGTFELFVAAFGLDELATSERFSSPARRMENFAELGERLTRAAGNVRGCRGAGGTSWRARTRCWQAAGGPRAGRVGVGQRPRRHCAVPDRRGGKIRIPNPPWRFDDVPGQITGEARYRGEDNRTVLREMLGYDDARIDELEAAGVLSSRPPRR